MKECTLWHMSAQGGKGCDTYTKTPVHPSLPCPVCALCHCLVALLSPLCVSGKRSNPFCSSSSSFFFSSLLAIFCYISVAFVIFHLFFFLSSLFPTSQFPTPRSVFLYTSRPSTCLAFLHRISHILRYLPHPSHPLKLPASPGYLPVYLCALSPSKQAQTYHNQQDPTVYSSSSHQDSII